MKSIELRDTLSDMALALRDERRARKALEERVAQLEELAKTLEETVRLEAAIACNDRLRKTNLYYP